MRQERKRVTAEESDDAVTKAIEGRRRAIEAEWSELGAIVVIGAGHPIPIPGRADRLYRSWLTASTST